MIMYCTRGMCESVTARCDTNVEHRSGKECLLTLISSCSREVRLWWRELIAARTKRVVAGVEKWKPRQGGRKQYEAEDEVGGGIGY